MHTNWLEVGIAVGSINPENFSQSGGTRYAQKALETILGDEWIKETVEHAIAYEIGSELAMNCLRHLQSEKACRYAYDVYKSSTGERARMAVWLIKHMANEISFQWVEEFIDDPNTVAWGLGVLDQLLWGDHIEYSEEVETLFAKASANSNGALDENIQFIREYLKNREEKNNYE